MTIPQIAALIAGNARRGLMRSIPLTCDPDRRLKRVPLAELVRFQGDLKTLHADQYAKLKKSISEKGFFAPVFVWQTHILDGHQRVNVLERENWDVEGGIPVVEIEAADEKDAAEKLLLLSSTYGKIDGQGLYEFTAEKGLDLREFDLPDLPDFDVAEYLESYYGATPDFGEVGEDEQGKLDELKHIKCPHCGGEFAPGESQYS